MKAGFLSGRTIQELDIWRAELRWAGTGDFVFSADGTAPLTNAAIVKAFRRG
ncbi:MAG: hypothetical protein LBK83_03805 [Treponema sp.]|nr:hypothetical protein [Treponema sp.]